MTDQADAPATQAAQTAQPAAGAKSYIKVKVYSPFRNYYDGEAYSVSAENATGPFDVLPKHHNFISLLKPSEVIIRPVNDKIQRILIAGGLMYVKSDQIIVFLDV